MKGVAPTSTPTYPVIAFKLIITNLRESSFNMTRGGDEDIETRSLEFQQPPSIAVQFFRSPPPPPSCRFWSIQIFGAPLIFSEPPFQSPPQYLHHPRHIKWTFPNNASYILRTAFISRSPFVRSASQGSVWGGKVIWTHFLQSTPGSPPHGQERFSILSYTPGTTYGLWQIFLAVFHTPQNTY